MRYILILLALLGWTDTADARWREASSRHFVIYSEADEAELRQAAEQFERYDSMLRFVTGVADPDRGPASRVTIFFVRDVQELRRIYGARQSGIWGFYLPYARGIIITPRIGYRSQRGSSVMRTSTPAAIEDSFNARGVMLHEYTHHFMFNNFNFGAPLWLSEGYPEFMSTARFEDDGSVTIGTPPWYRNNEISEARDINAQEVLLHPADNYKIQGIYGIGWLMSDYLTFDQHRTGQLAAYLHALDTGAQPEQAAAVFGDLDQLSSELRRYRTGSGFPLSRIPAAHISVGQISIRELSDAENAIMEVRIRSKRGVSRTTAPDVARDARAAAAPYPNNAFVQVSLAEAEYDAKNYVEAEAAADRAIAADPRLIDGYLYKARSMWARAEAAHDTTPRTWTAIREILAQANRIDPDDPQPLAFFYESYQPSGIAPTANAIDGLFVAQQMAPQESGLRILATRELLARNRVADARRLFAPIASSAHGSENREKVAQVMTLMQAGDGPGALAKLDELREEARRRDGEGS